MGLLTGLSGTCVASQGLVSFQGAIVEVPCRVSTSGKDIALQGCPGMAADQLISARSVEPVRSIEGSTAHIK
ncbi:hypothetical protein CES87_25380 [Pseudomonas sp. ERMR1:02]|nr:hypothetical protein CES87_25380 [Pseudomonas sp. ERMR1:02]